MNKLRVSFFAALALMVAFGVSGQALAQESVITITNPDFQLLSATHFGIVPPDSAPDATGLYQGIVAMGPLPATGTNDWPCFAGNAACPTIAAGGLVIG